jgi:hypothetical protein
VEIDARKRACNVPVLAALIGGALIAASPAPRAQSGLPAPLETYLTKSAHLSGDERRALLSGAPVTKLLDSDPSKEVAVLGAVWIAASPSACVQQMMDIERFERGGAFLVTKRIGNPPSADDFASLQLSDEDLDALRECRAGDCEVKLSANALQALRAGVDWTRPTARADANAIFKRLALQYVLGYPRVTLPNSSDFLYWQETQFGLKPTIRISHVLIQETPERTVVASKMLYASHDFWTALEVRVLLPDAARGRGFWFITANRSRSDGLSGFAGRFVRGRVRSEVESGTQAALTATKATLEGLGSAR